MILEILESIPATLTCWSLGMSSQSKQQRVSPVRNRLPFSASMSFTLQENMVNVKLMKWLICSLWFCEEVSCNIFNVWVFSALQHSLGEDGGHSVLARVVPLQQHVLELRVHILNLLVHLLEKQGYWQHTITSYLIYSCFDRTLSEMKRLCPPGMFFMMCLSIFSFSSTATPLSIKIGGWAASKFDLKSNIVKGTIDPRFGCFH